MGVTGITVRDGEERYCHNDGQSVIVINDDSKT